MERDYQEDDYCVSCNPGDPDSWNIPAGPVSAGEDGIIMAVADGMGGLNAGEVASRTAIGAIRNYFTFNRPSELLKNAGSHTAVLEKCIMDAHSCIVEHARKNPDSEGMGTTLVIAWIVGQHAYVAWCGDSRCYLSRNGVLRQISKDHSYVQELVEGGKITQEDAFFHPNRNIITQSLGDESRLPSPTCAFTDIKNGDKLLLCSDGLNSMLQDVEIESILEYSTGGTANRELVDAANRAGGHDNITVIVAEIGERPAPHSSVNIETRAPDIKKYHAAADMKTRRKSPFLKVVFVTALTLFILAGGAIIIKGWYNNELKNKSAEYKGKMNDSSNTRSIITDPNQSPVHPKYKPESAGVNKKGETSDTIPSKETKPNHTNKSGKDTAGVKVTLHDLPFNGTGVKYYGLQYMSGKKQDQLSRELLKNYQTPLEIITVPDNSSYLFVTIFKGSNEEVKLQIKSFLKKNKTIICEMDNMYKLKLNNTKPIIVKLEKDNKDYKKTNIYPLKEMIFPDYNCSN